MLLDPWLWLGLFILIAYTVEAITGFGSLVIGLSLGALLLPIPEIMPVLVPLNVLLSGYLAWRNRRHIQWAMLLRLILPLMLAGTVVGYLLRPWLGDQLLQLCFGILVLWFASRELWRIAQRHIAQPHPAWMSRGLTVAAGLTHGLFASGGPLLVYALAGTTLDKARLRATMVSVWFSLNAGLTFLFLLDGTLTAQLHRTVWYLPLLVVGLGVGEWLHHRLDEQRFRQCVYGLLVVTALALIAKAVV
jgi:uncharacterized protein